MKNLLVKFGEILVRQVPGLLIVDNRKIPRSVYMKVDPLLKEVDRLNHFAQKVDPQKPHTYVDAAKSLILSMVEDPPPAPPNPIYQYLDKEGYTEDINDVFEFLFEHFEDQNPEKKTIMSSDDEVLIKVNVSEDVYYYAIVGADKHELIKYIIADDEKVEEAIYAELAKKLWDTVTGSSDALQFHRDKDDVDIMPIKFVDRVYKGQMLAEILEMSRFTKKGIRRVLALQGKPGTGKSTLCQNVAKQMGGRCMVITNEFISNANRENWQDLMRIMKPDVVIIDDIDRVQSRQLSMSLYMFEDGEGYAVPLTLMTTNDINSTPEAFRRPGRIDQLVMMPSPTSKIQEEMLAEFASVLKVDVSDIPEKPKAFLIWLLAEQPGVYAQEILRRYSVLGWDREPAKHDIIYNDLYESFLRKHPQFKREESIQYDLVEISDDSYYSEEE